jgi:tryptophanyl-tRNA synthetase
MMEAKVEENLEKLKVEDAGNEETEEDIVDPWNVTSSSDKGIDYDKLIKKFGSKKIDDVLIERMEKDREKGSPFSKKRCIFFSS